MAAAEEGADLGVEDLLAARLLLNKLRFSYITSMSLKSAVELGIPDAVADLHRRLDRRRPVPLSDLASAISVHPSKTHHLRRIMSVLVHSGLFSGDPAAGEYLPTAASRILVKGSSPASSSFSHNALIALHPSFVDSAARMTDWLRGGEDTIAAGNHGGAGESFRELLRGAWAEDTGMLARALVDGCPELFSGLKSLVDVGGGDGTTARAVAEAFPELRCTVLDLPRVIESASREDGGRTAVRYVAGDMFEHVPPADAVLLQSVLHGWSDEECVRILRRCREAVWDGGKVIVVDMVMGAGDDPAAAEVQALWEVFMAAGVGRTEREEGEWREVFVAAGFSVFKIVRTIGERSIIEASP